MLLQELFNKSAVLSSSLLKEGMAISCFKSSMALVFNICVDFSVMTDDCAGSSGKQFRQFFRPANDHPFHPILEAAKALSSLGIIPANINCFSFSSA
jgi:hypothetical protein